VGSLVSTSLDHTSYRKILQVTVMLILCKMNCLPSWKTFFCRHTSSMWCTPTFKHYAESVWTVPWLVDFHSGPQNWPPWSLDHTLLNFYVWGYMRNVEYECNLHRREEQLYWIFIAARCVTDPVVLSKVIDSMVKQGRVHIQIEGRHFEHLLTELYINLFF
jgi:hypothetical protein